MFVPSLAGAAAFKWRSNYGGASVSDVKRLRELEAGNAKLKRMYADLALENEAIKDIHSSDKRRAKRSLLPEYRLVRLTPAACAGASQPRQVPVDSLVPRGARGRPPVRETTPVRHQTCGHVMRSAVR